VPALAFKNVRRLIVPLRLFVVIVIVVLSGSKLLLQTPTGTRLDRQKNRSLKSALSASPGQRRCLLALHWT
jgi:hypothetical protein